MSTYITNWCIIVFHLTIFKLFLHNCVLMYLIESELSQCSPYHFLQLELTVSCYNVGRGVYSGHRIDFGSGVLG